MHIYDLLLRRPASIWDLELVHHIRAYHVLDPGHNRAALVQQTCAALLPSIRTHSMSHSEHVYDLLLRPASIWDLELVHHIRAYHVFDPGHNRAALV